MEDAIWVIIGFILVAYIMWEWLEPSDRLIRQEERVLEDMGLVDGTNYIDGDMED